jgi:hypothetical protein
MALSLSDGAANFALNSGYGTMFDTNGRIAIYSGSSPGANAAATGTLLATVTLPADAFTTASSRSMTLNDPASVNAVATGTAGYFIMYNSTETAPGSVTTSSDKRIHGTVGTSGADLNLSSTSLTSGGPVDITGGTLTL